MVSSTRDLQLLGAKLVADKAGISESQARQAVEVVLGFLKDNW